MEIINMNEMKFDVYKIEHVTPEYEFTEEVDVDCEEDFKGFNYTRVNSCWPILKYEGYEVCKYLIDKYGIDNVFVIDNVNTQEEIDKHCEELNIVNAKIYNIDYSDVNDIVNDNKNCKALCYLGESPREPLEELFNGKIIKVDFD